MKNYYIELEPLEKKETTGYSGPNWFALTFVANTSQPLARSFGICNAPLTSITIKTKDIGTARSLAIYTFKQNVKKSQPLARPTLKDIAPNPFIKVY